VILATDFVSLIVIANLNAVVSVFQKMKNVYIQTSHAKRHTRLMYVNVLTIFVSLENGMNNVKSFES